MSEERVKIEHKHSTDNVPVDVAFPIEGLSGAELDAQLRRRAELRLRRRNNFFVGLAAYFAVNVIVWAIWFASWSPGASTFPWPIFVTLGWGIPLLGMGIPIYQDTAGVVRRREDRIQREIEIEKMRIGMTNKAYQKPKRDQAMRLSDDGELIPDDESDTKRDTISAKERGN